MTTVEIACYAILTAALLAVGGALLIHLRRRKAALAQIASHVEYARSVGDEVARRARADAEAKLADAIADQPRIDQIISNVTKGN